MGCMALRVYAESCLALHRFMRAANILVRSPPSPFSEWPKSAPGDSKSVSEGRKSSIEHFGGSKSSQDESKSAPRARQERPRVFQERQERRDSFSMCPKSTQVGPKSPPKGPWRTLGDHFEASNLDRGAFRKRSVARRAQEWFLKDLFDNFSLARKRRTSFRLVNSESK